MNIHPKTSGAAIGTALGVMIVAVLHSISGVHLTPEVNAAIPAFLGTLGSWLSPSVTPATRNNSVTSTPPAPPSPPPAA